MRCLVGYSRLCSKVWEALPPISYSAMTVPTEQVQYLDFLAHKWTSSIPADLQLLHPRLGLAQRPIPQTLRRLQALLYLRGNHMRILIHRHHVLSSSLIYADLTSSRLVVDIAKDSIQILVDLANTSDIYVRQQSAFNYFLLGALGIVLMAVCNAPELFSASCRESFSTSVTLVRGFSRQSHASKRLWRSIRGLIPAVKALGLEVPQGNSDNLANGDIYPVQRAQQGIENNQSIVIPQDVDATPRTASVDLAFDTVLTENASSGGALMPDVYQMGDDLMGLFDAFDQDRFGSGNGMTDSADINISGQHIALPAEVSRRFFDLI